MQDTFEIAKEIQRNAPVGMVFKVPKKYQVPENYALLKGQRMCRKKHETLFHVLTKAGYSIKYNKLSFKLPNLCMNKNENFIIKVL